MILFGLFVCLKLESFNDKLSAAETEAKEAKSLRSAAQVRTHPRPSPPPPSPPAIAIISFSDSAVKTFLVICFTLTRIGDWTLVLIGPWKSL